MTSHDEARAELRRLLKKHKQSSLWWTSRAHNCMPLDNQKGSIIQKIDDEFIDAAIAYANKQKAELLDELREYQRLWMHEHAELKLGYAVYLLSIIDLERKKLQTPDDGGDGEE